jgi:hypothetical protein
MKAKKNVSGWWAKSCGMKHGWNSGETAMVVLNPMDLQVGKASNSDVSHVCQYSRN